MKQVILNIPDDKYNFFVELIRNLGLGDADLFEEQKAIVRQRISDSKKEDLASWKEARKKFTFKK